MPLNVFNLDDRVVHQHAHHQRQAQQRDRVERVAKVLHAQKSRNHRQRQGGSRHQRGAPVAQKHPHHDHREHGAFVQQFHGAVKVFLHRLGVVDHQLERDVGPLRRQRRDRAAHTPAHVQLARAFGAQHFKADHHLAVLQGFGARLGRGVQHARHLVQPDVPAVGQRNVQPRQLTGGFDSGNRAHRLLGAAHVAAPARGFLLHQPQPARHVNGRHIERGHLRGVQLDADFPLHTADPFDTAHTGHAQQALGHGVVHEPAHILQVQARGFAVGIHHGRRAEGEHRPPGGADLGHLRVAHFAGQIGPDADHGVTHFSHGVGNRLFKDELHNHLRLAVQHLGGDVFHALQTGHGVFKLARHIGFQLRRRRAVERGGDDDHRQLNVREILHTGGFKRQQADQCEHGKQQQRRHRVANGIGREIQSRSLSDS